MFDEMNANYASEVLQNMSDDDAVDVLNLLSKTQRVSLLTIMDKHKSESLKSLLNYEEDTAGGIMTTEYVSLTPEMSVREALMHVKEKSSSAQTIYALYVVNDQKN